MKAEDRALVGLAEDVLGHSRDSVAIRLALGILRRLGGQPDRRLGEPRPLCRLCQGRGWLEVRRYDSRAGYTIVDAEPCECRELEVGARLSQTERAA